jgi:hypothetical protein
MRFMRASFLPIAILLLLPPTFGEDETDPGKLAILASEAYDAGRYEECGQLYAQAIEHGARLEGVSIPKTSSTRWTSAIRDDDQPAQGQVLCDQISPTDE